jgi:hypothetical protein
MFHIKSTRQNNMHDKMITLEKRKSVYAEGKRAFDEHMLRGYNPYARSSLTLAVQWWHGWDTAEEEKQAERLSIDECDLPNRSAVWL